MIHKRRSGYASQCTAKRIWLAGLLLCTLIMVAPTLALAQKAPPISVLADSIYINQTTDELIASGNVQVFFEGTTLYASEIRYNSRTDTVTASGPVRIVDAGGTVVTADFAELSADLKSGLATGARIMFANQLQIAAAEAARVNGSFNTMSNVVASSCLVCKARPTPIWQIRAEQVIQDEKAERIYFTHAKLELFGRPIFYLPTMSIPTTEVDRATGFLRPEFFSADSIGDGIRIPYYITLGDSADTTISTIVSLQGAALLDAEYRKVFPNGKFKLFGATALRDSAGFFQRGFLRSSGSFTLFEDITLDFNATAVTDKGFMKQYGYSNADRLVSEIALSRYRDRSYFSVAGAILTSLRDSENNATIPFVLPEFSYRSYRSDPLTGGRIGYEVNGVGLTRILGQDVARLGGSVDWTVPIDFSTGIQTTGFARLDGDIYRVWDNNTYPDRLLFNLHPTVGAELRWPLERTSDTGREVLVPVAQLIYTPDLVWNDTVPNEDSILVEFDETNLFEFSRYPGRDASEIGLRTNLGASYTLYTDQGWEFGLAGGVVLRSNPTTQFSQDILGAFRLETPSGFRFTERFLFDENLDIKRNEADLSISTEDWRLASSFVFLAPDPLAGSPVTRAEGSISGRYRFHPNWEARANWTRDLITDNDVAAGFGLTYGNECIEIGLSVSRRFTSSISVPAATDINLVIELAGFGGTSQNDWPDSRCAY